MTETQAKEREERAQRSETEKVEIKARRHHELELNRLEISNPRDIHEHDLVVWAKSPKLPVFEERNDDSDSYLLRYENLASQNRWQTGKLADIIKHPFNWQGT